MGLFTFQQQRRAEKARKEAEAIGQDVEQDDTDGGAGAAGAEGGTNGAGDGNGAAGGNTGAGDGAGGSNAEGNHAGAGSVADSTPGAKLTPEQYAEIMRNKGNVMAALKEHGAEFSDRTGAPELRQQLEAMLVAKDLLPEGGGHVTD